MKFAVIAVAVVVLALIIQYAQRIEYTVHTSGGVLLTGASTGIGQAAALHLASKGFRVYAAVRKEKDKDQFKSQPNIHPLILDVTKQQHINQAYDEISADLKKHNLQLVGLVNNAGVSPAAKPVEFADIDNVRYGFEVNVIAVFAITQKFLPLLRASKGRVINMSSLGGLICNFCQSAYSGTKWALEAFANALRQEMMQQGVSVSNINPGYVHTPIFAKVQASLKSPSSDPKVEEEVYGALIRGYSASVANNDVGGKFKGWTTQVTDDAILSALTDRYPNTNYLCAGADDTPGWIFARLHWLLPKRLFDLIIFAVQG